MVVIDEEPLRAVSNSIWVFTLCADIGGVACHVQRHHVENGVTCCMQAVPILNARCLARLPGCLWNSAADRTLKKH
jgi:hypothetical protein